MAYLTNIKNESHKIYVGINYKEVNSMNYTLYQLLTVLVTGALSNKAVGDYKDG